MKPKAPRLCAPRPVWAVICPNGRIAIYSASRREAMTFHRECDEDYCDCCETPHRIVRYVPEASR